MRAVAAGVAAWLALALCGLSAGAAPTGVREARLDRCDDAARWSANLGVEFAGARGRVSAARDATGACLRLDYDFRAGGEYVAAARDIDVRRAEAVSFTVRQDGANGGMARIQDATGQEHAAGYAAAGAGWHTVTLSLDERTFGAHWGGANDGRFHFPLKVILVGVNKWSGPAGSLFIRDLCVSTDDPSVFVGVTICTADPGNVAFTGARPVPVACTVENRISQPVRLSLALSATEWHGRRIALPAVALSLAARGSATRVLSVPGSDPAYWLVRADVRPANGASGVVPTSASTGVVVTPRPRNYGVDDPSSFFGIQNNTDGARTERLGVKWVRAGRDWRWGEMQHGVYAPPEVAGIRRNHQLILYNMTAYPPAWAEKLAAPDAFWEGDGADARTALWADYVERTARAAAADVDTFEVQNEPDLTCMWAAGLRFDAGVARYLRILRAGAAAIRKGAPRARVAGIDVSGGDYDAGLPFSRALMDRASGLIDVYSGHPYAGVRYFGSGQKPMWPVPNEERRKCLDTLAMIRRAGGRQRFWVGEKGWGLDVKADPLGEDSRDFARCLVQSMVIAHSVPGVDRYFWFMEEGCNEGGYEYGLFRQGMPLPAALAYATLARLLYHAAPSWSLAPRAGGHGGALQAHCFVSRETGDGTLVLWSEGDTGAILLSRLPAAVSVVDVMGRTAAAAPSGRALRVPLSREPVYLRFPGASAPAMCRAVERATLAVAHPVRLESAYLVDLGHVGVRVRNATRQPQPCVASAGRSSARVTLGPEEARVIALRAPGDLRSRPGRPLPVRVSAGGGVETLGVRTDLLACPRVADGQPTGDLARWRGRDPIVLDRRSQVLPADPGVGWSSGADLNARVWLGWDDGYLHVAAGVHDPVHFVQADEPGGFWDSDCIQIGIDPQNAAGPEGGYRPDDIELGVVLGRDGVRVNQTYPAMRRLDVPAAAERRGQDTCYDVAIPWKLLGVEPRPGLVLGLNLIVNNNNGAGRAYWMGMTPGIGEGKRPWVFRKVYLAERAPAAPAK